MSVLIKGMEMPKSCSKCGWFDMGGGDGYRCTLLRKSFDMWNKISVARDKNCPLIEIPTPHGRLGDLDKLWDRMYNYIDNEGAKMPYGDNDFMIHKDSACELIEDIPTIIEAEGERNE